MCACVFVFVCVCLSSKFLVSIGVSPPVRSQAAHVNLKLQGVLEDIFEHASTGPGCVLFWRLRLLFAYTYT